MSLGYFSEQHPFADYVVHEVAHIFHNCKRATLGLSHTRTREWLLDIAYAKRETFAYACEVYSRILDRAQSPAQRRAELARYACSPQFGDERVGPKELLDILSEAVDARNGWKKILAHCSNPKGERRRNPSSDHPGPGTETSPATTPHHAREPADAQTPD